MPVIITPPPQHYQVSDGYAAAQGCRNETDPGVYMACENKLSQGYKTAGDRSAAFFLGYAIAILARADQMEQAFRAAPPSPATARESAQASNLAMTGRIAVELSARKDGVAEAALPALIFRTSGLAPERWAYWRAKPVPDWLTKQAAQAKIPGQP